MTTEAPPPPAIVSYETKVRTIAAVLMAETGGIYLSMAAVAQVIHNRGGDPYEVVTARKQFSCLNRTAPYKLVTKWGTRFASGHYPRQDALDARAFARWLVDKQDRIYHADVGPATHYHSTKVRPYWAKGKKPIATIGGHKFYKLP